MYTIDLFLGVQDNCGNPNPSKYNYGKSMPGGGGHIGFLVSASHKLEFGLLLYLLLCRDSSLLLYMVGNVLHFNTRVVVNDKGRCK